MTNKILWNYYSHSSLRKLLAFIILLFTTFFGFGCCIMLIISIFYVITGQATIISLLALIYCMLGNWLMGIVFSSMYNDIQTSEQGIRVQVFQAWWVFVGWEDVLDIRPAFTSLQRTQVVFVNKLTPFHRFLGIMYGFKTVFYISPIIENHDELIKIITQHIKASP